MIKLKKNNEYIVQVEKISKKFKLYNNITKDILLEKLGLKKNKEKLVISRVSFNLKKGDVLGIIGFNGSGKTTLLRILAGTLVQSSGKFKINGRITSLFNVGVAVNPNYTGRETIFYMMSLYGYSKEKISKNVDNIINFSELNNFIDQPFRTYSTGMSSRLLFSIAVHIEGEIILIDEALNGGDKYFVEKAKAKIKKLCDSGATIIYVSHNTNEIQQLCNRVLLLDAGKMIFIGKPSVAIEKYNKLIFEKKGDLNKSNFDKNVLEKITFKDKKFIKIKDIYLKNKDKKICHNFYFNDTIYGTIEYESSFLKKEKVILFIGIDNFKKRNFVGEVFLNNNKILIKNRGNINFIIPSNPLLNDNYSLWVIIYDLKGNIICEYRDLFPFFSSRKKYSDQTDCIVGISGKIK